MHAQTLCQQFFVPKLQHLVTSNRPPSRLQDQEGLPKACVSISVYCRNVEFINNASCLISPDCFSLLLAVGGDKMLYIRYVGSTYTGTMHTHVDPAQTHNCTLHIITRRLAPVIAKLRMPMKMPPLDHRDLAFPRCLSPEGCPSGTRPIPPGVMSYLPAHVKRLFCLGQLFLLSTPDPV